MLRMGIYLDRSRLLSPLLTCDNNPAPVTVSITTQIAFPYLDRYLHRIVGATKT